MSLLDIVENVTGSHKESDTNKKVAHHIFGGSTTMIGVCITIVALFKGMGTGEDTFADEILGLDTFFFIASALLSYLSLRKGDDRRLEWWADIIFFLGMLAMAVVGIIIVFTDL